jgi:hypothetical protein
LLFTLSLPTEFSPLITFGCLSPLGSSDGFTGSLHSFGSRGGNPHLCTLCLNPCERRASIFAGFGNLHALANVLSARPATAPRLFDKLTRARSSQSWLIAVVLAAA